MDIHISVTVTEADGREIIAPFSMVLHDHDHVALIGEEGDGKSALLKALVQPKWLVGLQVSVNMTPPCVCGYLPASTQMNETVPAYAVIVDDSFWTNGQQVGQMGQLLAQQMPWLDLGDLYRPYASFSGGERVRLRLLGLQLQGADLWLLDEPANDLDRETLTWLQGWIRMRPEPVLFVSHDITLLQACATHVLHAERIQKRQVPRMTLYAGGYEAYVAHREQLITKTDQLADAQQRAQKQRYERWQKQYEKVRTRQDQAVRNPQAGRLLKKKMKQLKQQERRMSETQTLHRFETEAAIKLSTVHQAQAVPLIYTHPVLQVAQKILAKPIILHVQRGERVVITGRNGSGKTTLLTRIKEELSEKKVPFGWLPQDLWSLFVPDKSALAQLVSDPSREVETFVRQLLARLSFTQAEMERPLSQVSSGQLVKAAYAKLMLDTGGIWLLDEPTRHISPLSQQTIIDLLKETPVTMVMVSHDPQVMELADRVLSLSTEGLIETEK